MKFPKGRIPFEFEREDLAKVVKILMERRDTNIVGGNISIRVYDEEGKEYLVMTPTMMSEAYLGHLNADQILVIDPKTRKIISGTGKLTREINMHEAIYTANSNITCVFHAHADQAMFWATTGLNMPNITEATQKLKGIKTLEKLEREKRIDVIRQTAEVADTVVEKQMRIVQEIASLLGETAAETKIALSKLKESISNE